MSITGAMQTGVSGLLASGEALSVIGNNVANVNTAGYKEGRTLFSDMLSSKINNGQIGLGTQIQAVQNLFQQGSIKSTNSSTDLAIQGDAMFVLQDPESNARYYSRAGDFSFDNNNILVNPDGEQVLGFGVTNGVSNGVLGTIDLSNYATMAPSATSSITLIANLDSSAAVPTAAWTPAAAGFNPIDASNFSASTSVYDAAGNATQMTLYFAKSATANTWNVYTYDGTTYSAASVGTVAFNADGSLASGSPLSVTSSSGSTVAVDLTGTTQYSGTSSISTLSQDGYGMGTQQKVSIDSSGYVNVLYTNSQTQKIAQVALAKFASLQGLEKAGSNLYTETTASGQAIIDPSNMTNNKIMSNSLEESNVDLADQLVQMITTQRAYQANSKTITTADQMIQDTLSIIR